MLVNPVRGKTERGKEASNGVQAQRYNGMKETVHIIRGSECHHSREYRSFWKGDVQIILKNMKKNNSPVQVDMAYALL